MKPAEKQGTASRRTFIKQTGLGLTAAAAAPFFIRRACAQTGDSRTLCVNPYQTVDWDTVQRLKANLHTHSTNSDGRLAPHEVVDAYHALGYGVLALTDHNRCTYPWTAFDGIKDGYENRDPDALDMLAVAGNELSRHHHTLSLFSNFESLDTDWETVLTALGEYSEKARGIVCHPAMHWPSSAAVCNEVKTPLTTALRQITQHDFTVEACFRTTDAGRHVLLGNYSGFWQGALNLELHTDNRVRLFLQGPSETVDLNLSADTLGINTRDGHWHHLAGVRADGQVALYLDGCLVGQRADAAGCFDLAGDAYYLGRDTRTGTTVLCGDLGPVRLWTRGLSAAEIAVAAKDRQPCGGSGFVDSDGLLVEYRFETTGGVPLAAGAFKKGQVDDVAGHPDGPFHAAAQGSVLEVVVSGTCGPLTVSRARSMRHALRFGAIDTQTLPSEVPDAVSDDYAARFTRHGHLKCIEVSNGTRPLTEYPLDRGLWDAILMRLMPRRPVWGAAVDDMHATTHLGRDWIVFLTARFDEDAVRDSLDNGAFVFSTKRIRPEGAEGTLPPVVSRISHDASSARLSLSAASDGSPLPDSAYAWIADGVQIQTGPELNYRTAEGISRYVRAEITGAGGTTFTNPFGFDSRT